MVTKKKVDPLIDIDEDLNIEIEDVNLEIEEAASVSPKKPRAKKVPIVELPDEDLCENEESIVSKIPSVDPVYLLPIKTDAVIIAELTVPKKTSKTSFIYEINEAEERLNKKKYTEIKPEEKLTKAIRTSDRRGEESQEEMEARIARLLQEDDRSNVDPDHIQWCTKCGIFPVTDMYVIDRNLGFCDECAFLLRLGETKEAKTFDFGIGSNEDEEAAEDAAY